MTFRRLALCAAAALVLGSCDVPTSPNDRVYLQLFQFETPDVVSSGDTVRVGFRYSTWCGSAPSLDLSLRRGDIRVGVWTRRKELDRICVAIYPISVRTEFLLPPQYLGPERTVVRFRQPEGADSVRSIVTQAAESRAP